MPFDHELVWLPEEAVYQPFEYDRYAVTGLPERYGSPAYWPETGPTADGVRAVHRYHSYGEDNLEAWAVIDTATVPLNGSTSFGFQLAQLEIEVTYEVVYNPVVTSTVGQVAGFLHTPVDPFCVVTYDQDNSIAIVLESGENVGIQTAVRTYVRTYDFSAMLVAEGVLRNSPMFSVVSGAPLGFGDQPVGSEPASITTVHDVRVRYNQLIVDVPPEEISAVSELSRSRFVRRKNS